jgi:ribosomal protein S6--L-glutamate ligase
MKLAILGPGENYIRYSTKRILEEARKDFKKVDLVPLIDVKLKVEKKLEVIWGKNSLEKYDYILPRIDSKRAGIGYPVVRFLDDMDVKKPYPAETIPISHNKFLTLQELVKHGIKVPKTYLTGSKQSAKEIVNKEGLPIILKLLSSYGGHGVMFMESKEAANSAIETMKTLKQEVCLEEYIKNPGEDLRGIVAGDEIIASFKRIAAKGEKKANYHSGGRADVFKLSQEQEEIVFKSAKAVNSKICAVDMLDNNGETFVIEININPGLELIEKTTNLNVAQRIMNYIKSEVKK